MVDTLDYDIDEMREIYRAMCRYEGKVVLDDNDEVVGIIRSDAIAKFLGQRNGWEVIDDRYCFDMIPPKPGSRKPGDPEPEQREENQSR
jgi:hypothetical protein